MNIQKAWGPYWEEVKHDVDSEGFYNRGRDLVKKNFPLIETEETCNKVRPVSLRILEIPVIDSEVVVPEKKTKKPTSEVE